MRAIEDPYLRKAAELADMAENAKNAQSRTDYAVLADCYRRLSRRVAAFAPSPSDDDIEALAERMTGK